MIAILTHVFGRSLVVSLKMQNLKGFRQSIWLKTDWKLRKNGSHCSAPSSKQVFGNPGFHVAHEIFQCSPYSGCATLAAPDLVLEVARCATERRNAPPERCRLSSVRGLIQIVNCLNRGRFHSGDSMSSNSSSE